MDAQRFLEQLREALGAADVDAHVVPTDNRVRLISASRRERRLELRVSRRVSALGEPLIDDVVAWLGGDRRAVGRMRARVREIPRDADAGPPARRAVAIEPRGAYHDLAALAEFERARYLPGVASVPVTWGRRPARRRRPQRSIRLGSYDPTRTLIRVHRRLDHPRVPGWFIGFVIYHELLHHVLGVPTRGCGARVHTPEFRAREAAHVHFDDAQRWERAFLPRLLDGSL